MDLRQLETLVAVAETRSFAGAARIVNLTASAVSQQIQALEAEVGVSLFDRRTRPPRLNAQGEEMVRAARQMVQTMTETRRTITGGRTSGVLNFGAIRTVSLWLAPLAFAAMRAQFPALSFDLRVGVSEALMADVSAGRLDAAVVAEHVGVPAGLIWTPVVTEPLLLVAPPGAEGQDARALLAEYPFIRYETDVPLSRQIETELSRIGVRRREIAVSNTMPSIVGCVQAGLGVAVVPKLATLNLPTGSLQILPFGQEPITRRIGLVQREVSARSKVLGAMRDTLAATAGEYGLV
ncbi:DNA-binding transcriptional regulator, LysR family [Roseivivax lentus]|uniref:DNA-binding transcriptional regulator, LysR family n=1 Tax=Roseivivax lentus TaxID=633194 RepID=A0A1N7N971_9RHOB|nr:LysR family transcriptional regulator [Roseivivax lentus]SIS94880.1 DNA-binding transcriptional regulator, LysR family [Roseivivax lentus]